MDNTLKTNNPLKNAMAFSLLLENGRTKILNEDLYNEQMKKIENGETNSDFMTPEWQKDVLEIAKYMANMKEKDLRNYIFEIVKEERTAERER